MKRSEVIRAVWNWPEAQRVRGKFYNEDSGGGCVAGAMFRVLGVPPNYVTAACLGLDHNRTIAGLNAAPSELCRFVDAMRAYLTKSRTRTIVLTWDALRSWKLATVALWFALPEEVPVYVPPVVRPRPRPRPAPVGVPPRAEELVEVS